MWDTSWESLVAKTRWKATDPLIHEKGRLPLLLQLGRKAHVHGGLEMRTDSPGRLQKYPKIHVSTGEESSGFGLTPHKFLGTSIDGRGIPRGPRATRMGTGLS